MSDNELIAAAAIFLVIVLIIGASLGTPTTIEEQSTQKENLNMATITINQSTTVTTNPLELGFQLDGRDVSRFVSSSTLRGLAREANFKTVRVFHHRYAHYPQGSVYYPVTAWNNVTKTGTWNWTETDDLINKIIAIGAKPVICLMYKGVGAASIPAGMNSWATDTDLPDPDQYAAYCRKWVNRYGTTIDYEIANEMMQHYYWNTAGLRNNYYTWWSTIAAEMRTENSGINLGDECIAEAMLDKFVSEGITLDFIAFHKYDSSTAHPATDSVLFTRAESEVYPAVYGAVDAYTVAEARTAYGSTTVPIVCGEANINWKFNPTDPRIQTMTAAVWAALTIRYYSLNGLNYWLWWDLWGAGSQSTSFAMIESSNQPWYSYQVLKMFSTNIDVGDTIVSSTSSSSNLRTHAWIHDGTLFLWVIHKSEGTTNFTLSGVSGPINYTQVDASHRYPLTGTVSASDAFSFSGYTVMLMEFVDAPPEPEPPIPPGTPDYYYVDVRADSNGQASPAGRNQILLGNGFRAVASPNIDYSLDRWKRDGDNVSSSRTYFMTSNYGNRVYDLVAYFASDSPTEPDPPDPPATDYFSINISAQTGGSTSLTGSQTVEYGQTFTAMATPDFNYRFCYWLLNNVEDSHNLTFSLTGVANASYTLLAVFQYVTPPPPDEPFLPASDKVAVLSSKKVLANVMKGISKSEPIKLSDILKRL